MHIFKLFAFLCISFISGEVFMFERPGEEMKIQLTLLPRNINSGFFKPINGKNMTYKVKMHAIDRETRVQKVLYDSEKLEENKESHFSFNNVLSEEVVISITSILIDQSSSFTPGLIQMKFDSIDDTFDSNTAKDRQIEPAIAALERLLKRMKDVTATSDVVINSLGSLQRQKGSMRTLVVFFSFGSFIGYAIFNCLQVYQMKKYLNEKKYL